MAENTENKTEDKTWKNLVFEEDEKGNLKEVAPEVVETKKDADVDSAAVEATENKTEAETDDRRKPTRNDRLRRQRDEARTAVSSLQMELAELKAAREQDAKTVVTTVTSQLDAFEGAAKSRFSMAQDAYKKAFADQDPDAAIKANVELNRAMLDLNTVATQKQRIKSVPEPKKANGNGQVPRQGIHPKAQDWMDVNSDLIEDQDTFAIVKTIDMNLQSAGSDPETDEHYKEIDKKLTKLGIKKVAETKAAPTGPTNGSRGGTVPRGRVTATQDDMDSARRLGVTIQDYLKQKSMPVDDNGYVRVM